MGAGPLRAQHLAPAVGAALFACAPSPPPAAPPLRSPSAPAPAAVATLRAVTTPPMATAMATATATTTARPPVTLTAGRRALTITFAAHPSGRVETLEEGERTFVPSSCPGSNGEGLCSTAHRALRGEGTRPMARVAQGAGPLAETFGKGRDLLFVAAHENAELALAVFASTTWGSPECGVYAYWVVRLDERGARAGEPLVGCFGEAFGEHQGPPFVTFSRPVVLWPDAPAPSRASTLYVLDEATLRFSPKLTVTGR